MYCHCHLVKEKVENGLRLSDFSLFDYIISYLLFIKLSYQYLIVLRTLERYPFPTPN